MKKIAIFVCGEVSKKCTANGCLRAVNQREDAFEIYGETGHQLVAFNNCSGCAGDPVEGLEVKIEKFKKADVDVVHLSTCIRGRCEYYEEFAEVLSEYFDIIGYTHGSAEGKKRNNVNKIKVKQSDEL